MTSKKFSFQLPGLALALSLAACGGSEDEAGRVTMPPAERGGEQSQSQGSTPREGQDQMVEPSDGTCTAARSLCATIEVPAGYASKPTKLLGALYDQLPPVTAPRKILATVESPAIGVGTPYQLQVNDLDVQGEYFVYIAVYSEGGGPFVPVPGVDYVTQSERKVKFDGSPINLGTMTLRLEETP